MRLNDYFASVNCSVEEFQFPRIIVARASGAHDLKIFYGNETHAETVLASDCIDGDERLPPPPLLFQRVKEKIRLANRLGKLACVFGWTDYLSLLSCQNRLVGFDELRSFLDCGDLKAVFVINDDPEMLSKAFNNPVYRQGRQLISIEEQSNDRPLFCPRIVILSSELASHPLIWPKPIYCSAFLKKLQCVEWGESDECRIQMDYSGATTIFGLNEAIVQVSSPESYFANCQSWPQSLDKSLIPWMYDEMRTCDAGITVEKFLSDRFTYDGDNVLSLWIKHWSQEETKCLYWITKQRATKNSYLEHVFLEASTSPESFVRGYVCAAVTLPPTEEKVIERKKGIHAMGEQAASCLIDFISLAREHDLHVNTVIPWLNCETQEERLELIRRARELDDFAFRKGLPKDIAERYADLDAYLSPWPSHVSGLADYFTQYRLAKVRDRVTPDFCIRAKSECASIIPIKSRNEILQGYQQDAETALIIVDALGAEYTPMLLTLAGRRGITVLSCEIGRSVLPSSTSFNMQSISFPPERMLPKIDEFDAMLHKGPLVYGILQGDRNQLYLVEALTILSGLVMNTVVNVLKRFKRVIVTGDHGASRLAVLAHRQTLASEITLPADILPDDWRYVHIPKDVVQPEAVCQNETMEYWVVKGYDHFHKKVKPYETHGGCTPEEQLVPVIVFDAGKRNPLLPQTKASQDVSELQENSDFDL